MSVTEAAKRLGVGRPTLTNMLNGKAALSEKMATLLSEAFNADADALLQMQSEFNAAQGRSARPSISPRIHHPTLFDVRAREMESWANNSLLARDHLPALLRVLVLTTGEELNTVEFHAFDNAQRHGWDGYVEAGRATPWVPNGASGWEFGVNKNLKIKADGDYEARTTATAETTRLQTTFVFVTPRNWHGKTTWVNEKRAERKWRDVRAYDASDLEHWLETSVPAQVRFIELLGGDTSGVRSLDRCWSEWANACDPRLTNDLFAWHVKAFASKCESWLSSSEAKPLVVTADSREEALAGLFCLFTSNHVRDVDRVIVISEAARVARIAAEQTEIIAILDTEDAQKASGLLREHKKILVTNRDLPGWSEEDGTEDLRFGLVPPEAFREALEALRLKGGKDRIDQLVEETGRSLTVLRRRLSDIPAIQMPQWADDVEIARNLIPFALMGAWRNDSDADRKALSSLAGVDDETLQRQFSDLLAATASPVWAVVQHRGVLSQVDIFYAVRQRVTDTDLNRFFAAGSAILGERDPSLDLPEEDRWAANIYGKSRRFSSALQMGVASSLTWLSIHGDGAFKHLGGSVKARVGQFIRGLLTPFDEEKWLSQRAFLISYAEAAPDVFLDMLEEDLARDTPTLHALMKPVDASLFGSSPARTELLWALEVLAWNPDLLSRVVDVLAELAKLPLDDNWANKPDESLAAIFRAWIPQTAASPAKRIALLKRLRRKAPDVAWQLCIDQFEPGPKVGHYSHRPKWRDDAVGYGDGATWGDIRTVTSAAFDLAIGWDRLDAGKLGDLLGRLAGVSEPMANSVWDAIDQWIETNPDDWEKGALREKIRTTLLTRRGRTRGFDQKMRGRARNTIDRLEPSDLLARHDWLLSKSYVDYSADELEEEDLDYEERDRRITNQRATALREVWDNRGFEGIAAACARAEAPGMLGWALALEPFDEDDQRRVINQILEKEAEVPERLMTLLLSGLIRGLGAERRGYILGDYLDEVDRGTRPWAHGLRLLIAAPFGPDTFSIIEGMTEDRRHAYWSSVQDNHLFHVGSDTLELAAQRFREVNRPQAALVAIDRYAKQISSPTLVGILEDVARGGSEADREMRLDSHSISDVFNVLSERTDVTRHQFAMLEFAYSEILTNRTKHGIQNLETILAESPDMFVRFLCFIFKRSDDQEDPPHLRAPNDTNHEILSRRAYRVLQHASLTPGSVDDGDVDSRVLVKWVTGVRRLAKECARFDIAESMIGQLLGRCLVDSDDGMWPHKGVREALEEIGTSDLLPGIEIGRRNTRGVVSRGKGGQQERDIAAEYRSWAQAVDDEHPMTAHLLNRLAESYDHEAKSWDGREEINARLRGW